MEIITLNDVGVAILSAALMNTEGVKDVDISQLACKISALTYESLGEPYYGKIGVANVIDVRTNKKFMSDGTTCGTVTKPKQFSYLNNGYPLLLDIRTEREKNAFRDVVEIAIKSEKGVLKNITGCADHYLNPKTVLKYGKLPKWYDKNKVTFTHYNHEWLKITKGGCNG